MNSTLDPVEILTIRASQIQVKSQLEIVRQKLKRLDHLRTSHACRIKELEVEKSTIEGKVAAIRAHVEKLQIRDVETQKVLTTLERANAENKSKLSQTQRKLNEKIAFLAQQRQKVQTKEREVRRLKSLYKEKTAVAELVRNKTSDLERRASVVSQAAMECEKDLAKNRRTIESLNEEFAQSHTDKEATQIQVDALASQVQEAKRKLNFAERRASVASVNSNAQIKSMLNDIKSERQWIMQEITKKQSILKSMREKNYVDNISQDFVE